MDNDFISHLVETKITDGEFIAYLRKVLLGMELEAIMHPLVYEKELPKNSQRTMQLFKEKIIHKVEFLDITGNDAAKESYYSFLVRSFYSELFRKPFPVADDQLQGFWKAKSSLGEIHTMAMCLLCGCNLFMSDDGDSQRLARFIQNKTLGQIMVYRRKDLFDEYENKGNPPIPRKIKRALTHTKFD